MIDKCLIFEFSKPVQWKPFKFNTSIMWRIGWLWFSIAIIKMPLYDFCKGTENDKYGWIGERRKNEDN